MHYFKFTDEWGQHAISATDAQSLLQVSRRTIQNYQHPERRDAARWDYLTAYATGRIIPAHWDIRIRGDELHTGTNKSIPRWQFEQVAFAHSLKDNTIAGLQTENAALTSALDKLTADVEQLKKVIDNHQPKPASNVIYLQKQGTRT